MRIIFLIILTCISSTIANAQSSIPVPEFKNSINHVDTVKNTLDNLEKNVGSMSQKIKTLGLRGSDLYLKLLGSHSSVIIEKATFVVKLPDSDTDPSSYIALYRLTSDKDKRELLIAGQKAFSNFNNNANMPKVELNFSKIIPGVYLITVQKELTRGSYGFIFEPETLVKQASGMTATVFAFDIN